MTQHILPVAGTVAQLAQQTDQLMVKAVHADFQRCSLAFLLDDRLHFLFGLLDHFLDSGRMNAPVHNELLQRNPGDLTANRIEAGDDNRLRRVINDEIHSGHGLQRADVPTLAADDPPLHLIAGQLDHGNRSLRHMIGCASLNGADHVLSGPFLRFLLGFCLDLLDHHGRVVSYSIFNSF